MRIINCKNYSELSKKTASFIAKIIKNLFKNNDEIVIGVSGGSSFNDAYELLGKNKVIDWDRVHIFFVDERIVSLEDNLSNYKNFLELFGRKGNVYGYRDVKEYNDLFYEKSNKKKVFDLVLLGAGEDGHVASLFPNHSLMDLRGKRYVEIDDSPKEPKKRVTVTRNVIEESKNALLLFASFNKKRAFGKFKSGKISAKECPAKIVKKVKNLVVLTSF
ncbi:MAG: 6-phosphogluconolactonase [Nanoarchaeota archaeon]